MSYFIDFCDNSAISYWYNQFGIYLEENNQIQILVKSSRTKFEFVGDSVNGEFRKDDYRRV